MSPVIINEFELIPAAPEDTVERDGTAEAAPAAAPPPRSPLHEAERLIRHETARGLRVWAH